MIAQIHQKLRHFGEVRLSAGVVLQVGVGEHLPLEKTHQKVVVEKVKGGDDDHLPLEVVEDEGLHLRDEGGGRGEGEEGGRGGGGGGGGATIGAECGHARDFVFLFFDFGRNKNGSSANKAKARTIDGNDVEKHVHEPDRGVDGEVTQTTRLPHLTHPVHRRRAVLLVPWVCVAAKPVCKELRVLRGLFLPHLFVNVIVKPKYLQYFLRYAGVLLNYFLRRGFAGTVYSKVVPKQR